MVSGKPSNQSARGVDIPPTTCIWFFWLLGSACGNTCCKGNQEYGFCSRATDVRPAVACGGSDPRVGMKGKRLLRNDPLVFQACVLGLPLQGFEIRFRNRPFLAEIETA
jgi:hypothetical protein